jgi:hypothetical protein
MMELKEREEIIKALECCSVWENCDGCTYRNSVALGCTSKMMRAALALIKELTEENEQWRNDWERNQSQREEAYEKLESDTMRKFADYLEKQSFTCDPDNGFSFDAIDVDELDDYVKEFLEEGE